MTGPEHYRAAEQYAAKAMELVMQDEPGPGTAFAVEGYQRQAQVHATLALAAATAELHPNGPWLDAVKWSSTDEG